MKKELKLLVIKKEFSNIFHSKSIMLLIVAIVLIPFVYSFCFLTSAWDPYGNTGKVPIAVVNNDEPTTLQGKKVAVGAETVKKLRKDNQLGWHIVNAAQAAKGLKNNKYYTVVTIPQNFSKNAATVLNLHPKQMKLTYKTNGSLNYISEVMSQVGADKLNAQIRANVTNAFASTLFEQVGGIGKKIGTAATGATQINEGTVKLDNGVNQYTVGVSKVHDGIQTMKVAAKPLSSGVQQLTDGGHQLATGLDQLAGNIPALSSGVRQLDDGSHQIKGGLVEINGQINGTGDSDLTGGVQSLTDGMNELNQKVNHGTGNTPSMVSAIEQLSTGMKQLNTSVNVANGSDPSLVSAVEQLNDGMSQLDTGLKQLQKQTLGNNKSSDPTEYGLAKGTEYITNKMLTLQDKVKTQISALSLASMMLKSNVKSAKATQDAADKKMEAAIAGVKDATQKAALEAAWKETTAAQTKTQTVLDNGKTLTNDDAKNPIGAMSKISAMSVLNLVDYNMSTTETDPATGDPNGLKTAVDQFASGLTVMNKKLNPTEKNATGFDAGIKQLVDGSAQLKAGINKLYKQRGTLADGVAQLNDGLSQMNGSRKQLASGVQQLDDGLVTLNGKAPKLSSGITALLAGSGKLSTGLDQLNGKVPTLASGVTQLDNGGHKLSGGLDQLNSKVPQLLDGVNQLADGTTQLTDNSGQLTDGTSQLKDGTKQLADGLNAGYKQINDVKLTKATAKMFAEPSKDIQKRMTTVPNYGAALAPYVLALALFIAIIIFNFTYPMRRHDGYKSVADWFKAKIAVGTLVALAMALIEATLMMVVGLPVDHVAQFYGMTILFALSAMYMTQMLNLAFGGVGIFVALGLLTMSGSGGLFPAETISPLYEGFQKFLPMTYAINGFRNAITSGIASATVAESVFILIAIGVISIALMFPAIKYLMGKLEAEARD
ncbi:YhgE/Pip family protein [Lacticaseibacillus hulanensis]|uniref:YhgE/Pip family protein n=1 Tax=Lacticaseibacillus hulanensis TaxID=2493111 RepID=UPI0013E3857B|nr:YhgE/Pip domain-containing protein [Lacticaseibacillus hulanensis]